MAAEKWVTVDKKWCELIQLDVDLQELRVYPDDIIPGPERFRVKAQRCTADVACNMAGVPCCYAYNNPGVDQFHLD